RIRAKFASAGLDPARFDPQLWFTGEATPERADLARRARIQVPDATLVILGDTPSDGAAAVAAGIPFLAVATGAFDLEVLRGSGAENRAVPEFLGDTPSLGARPRRVAGFLRNGAMWRGLEWRLPVRPPRSTGAAPSRGARRGASAARRRHGRRRSSRDPPASRW